MIIPLIWLKDYVQTSKSPKEIAKIFTEIGLMLDRPISGEVLDLEHRMDRADWLSITGCARDFAAYENLKFHFPKLESEDLEKNHEVYVRVDSDKVNRFRTRIIKNIKVGESPEFIKERLTAYGLPIINNIVDITNYVMVEMGQPLHAQDLDKFETKEIILRDTKEGEVIQTLDSSKVKLPEGTLVLSESGNPICIGGIVGGLRTGVSNETTTIVLDAGNYNQSAIRKTSRNVGIRNETVSRSEKFLSPDLVDLAIVRATDLILEIAGGEAFENSDFEKEKNHLKKMTLHKKRLELISGEDKYFSKASKILNHLDYKILEEDEEKIKVEVPHFRTDVEVEDDLIADVLRISGYSKINPEPIFNYPPQEITTPETKMEIKLSNILVSAGFHEHITDPIVKYDGIESRILLMNSVNSDKDALRLSLKETLTQTLINYQKHNKTPIKLFEIGNKYYRNENEFLEEKVLGVIYEESNPEIRSYKLRGAIDLILNELGINYTLTKSKHNISIISGQEEIGFFDGNYAEFSIKKLVKHYNFKPQVLTEFENFAKEDLTFVSHLDFDNGEILEYVRNLNPLIAKIEYLNEYIEGNSRRVTFRFYSLYPDEMKRLREEIIANTSKKYNLRFTL
jgi:phenylalanyl-tRNA synthetase beta subunit